MKKILLLLPLAILITKVCMAQHTLTAQDRKNYILTIDQTKIGKLHTVTRDNKKFDLVLVSVKLANNSNDTLRYLSWSCGWPDIYCTNNEVMLVDGSICEYNAPVIETILPHRSILKNIPIIVSKDITEHAVKFIIGIHLNKILIGDRDNEYIELLVDIKDHPDKYKNILIWSNEASILLNDSLGKN